jgi:pyruvate,water dikinase
LQATAKAVQEIILKAKMPSGLQAEIERAYGKLGGSSAVAVRSSATAEDLPEASFAGQQATFLNVVGKKDVVVAVQKAWASLFEARAIFYRVNQGFDHFKVGIAVPVQKMVQSTVSGVMFSINPITNDPDTVVIEAIWGLGENIVQGTVTPDHYEVSKKNWAVVQKRLAPQQIEMVRKGDTTKNYPVPSSRHDRLKLTDKQIVELAKLGDKLHQHYNKPQDSEWAMEDDTLFLVQTRPITTVQAVGRKQASASIEQWLAQQKLILKGEAASPGIVSGVVRHIPTPEDIHKLQVGDIMVTSMTTPDFVPAMKKAGGLITDRGGQTSHAAIVSREMGLVCVVGTGTATTTLKDGQEVIIDGGAGCVYAGHLEKEQLADISQAAARPAAADRPHYKTATKVYVNLAEPEYAARVAAENVDGIGLLRAEFMIAELGQHPKALLEHKKGQVFIRHMVKNLSTFCAAFGDRPVVYRCTDFKTNEYRHLEGGEPYEPQEENPLLGYRGAFRYATDPKLFALELEALRQTRDKFKNLWVMIPFVRSVSEFQAVKSLMYQAGLRRSSNFKIWMMVEIPENVIMIDDYIAAGLDGVSIGTNDLTMLMLGTDRDNENVARDYNEEHPAVLWALERTVRKCRAGGITVSVCGQAPTTHQVLVGKLVEWGVTSLSVTPDAIDSTRELIAAAEERYLKNKKHT